MTPQIDKSTTLNDVLAIVVNRFCDIADRTPSSFPGEARALRLELRKIRPAAFGISAKTFGNLRSLLSAAFS
jgi:hypothetical protein